MSNVKEKGYLPRFLQVGFVGFVVDAGVLWFLVYVQQMPPIPARAISFAATIAVTFVLNARYTFGASIRQSSLGKYTLIQLVGAAINFATFSLLVTYGPLVGWPLIVLVIGSICASVHNYIMMRRFVFAAATGKPPTSN